MKKYILLVYIALISQLTQAQVTSFNIDSSKFIKPLTKTLDSIYIEDQKPREAFAQAVKRKDPQSVVDSLRKIMLFKDHENLEKVNAIIAKYGWLGPEQIGLNASQALFLVLQHADLATQKKYLPMIRSAEKRGQVLSSNLAIMEDRVEMREGKKQPYGSQAIKDPQSGQLYFYPIEDPDHVDERRKSMGLIPMIEYAKAMDMTWDLEDYKRKLPEYEEKAKKIFKKP